MPTVIDSLIISLGLDTSQFKKGEKEYLDSLRKMERQSEVTNKSMQKGTKDLSESIGVMTSKVLALATAFISVGAAKSFSDKLTKDDAALGRAAANINSTTEELSLWEGVVKRISGDSAGISDSFRAITQSLEQWKITGQVPEWAKYFTAAHISMIDRATGKQKSFTQVMMETSKLMQGMEAPQAQAWGRNMGLPENMVNVLMQGPEATAKLLSEQRGIITGEQAKQAQERQESEAKLTAALTELGRNAISELSGSIVRLNNIMTSILEEIIKVTGTHPVDSITSGTWFNPTSIGAEPEIGPGGQPIFKGKYSGSGLGALVRKLESGDNYGAINTDVSNVSDKQGLKKAFSAGYSAKTLNEIIADEAAGKYQAAGAYQIRGTTLSDAVKSMGLSGNEYFTRDMQDRIFNEFLVPRRMKGTQNESLKGLINEFDALKGHESETMNQLKSMSYGSSVSSNSDNSISIQSLTIQSEARNAKELTADLRRSIGRNFSMVSQANTALS